MPLELTPEQQKAHDAILGFVDDYDLGQGPGDGSAPETKDLPVSPDDERKYSEYDGIRSLRDNETSRLMEKLKASRGKGMLQAPQEDPKPGARAELDPMPVPEVGLPGSRLAAGMPAPDDKPMPYRTPHRSPPQDDELKQAQDDAAERRSTAQLGKAVTAFTERPNYSADYLMRLGGGGVSAAPEHNDMWDKYGEEGNKRVSDLLERRKSAAGLEAQDKQRQVDAALDDPQSQTTSFARQIWEQSTGMKLPDGMTARDVMTQNKEFAPIIHAKAEETKAANAEKKSALSLEGQKQQLKTEYANAVSKLPPNATKEQISQAESEDQKISSEIDDSVNDVHAADGFRITHEGRLNRLDNQKHSDESQDRTIQAAKDAAAERARTERNNEIFRNGLPHDMPETEKQRALGLRDSQGAIDQYEENLQKTKDYSGKIGAIVPMVGGTGLLGSGTAKGSTFEADRERTAIALARGLEGGKATPGNVEIIMKMLAKGTDSEQVKAEKTAQLREFMHRKQIDMEDEISTSNWKGVTHAMSTKQSVGPKTVKMRFPDGSEHDVPDNQIENAESRGGEKI